jgi:hypothetical protein
MEVDRDDLIGRADHRVAPSTLDVIDPIVQPEAVFRGATGYIDSWGPSGFIAARETENPALGLRASGDLTPVYLHPSRHRETTMIGSSVIAYALGAG